MITQPVIVVAVAAVSLVHGSLVARQTPSQVKVCNLLPKAEVKKLIGGTDSFDTIEPREEPNASGSSCRYSRELLIMVHGGTFDALRKVGPPLETLTGVGEEAYLLNNPAGAVEIFARVGSRLVTVSRPVRTGGTFATERPGVIALVNALVAKLQ